MSEEKKDQKKINIVLEVQSLRHKLSTSLKKSKTKEQENGKIDS